VIEGQRLAMRERRDAVLEMEAGSSDPAARQITLEVLDDLWSDYLAAITELRAGTPWLSLGGKDPHRTYLAEVHAMFERMTASIDEEVEARIADPASHTPGRQRGATWTYLTTDEPFGPLTERIIRGVMRMIRTK
jgi:preprotein translocase subunit SecA